MRNKPGDDKCVHCLEIEQGEAHMDWDTGEPYYTSSDEESEEIDEYVTSDEY